MKKTLIFLFISLAALMLVAMHGRKAQGLRLKAQGLRRMTRSVSCEAEGSKPKAESLKPKAEGLRYVAGPMADKAALDFLWARYPGNKIP